MSSSSSAVQADTWDELRRLHLERHDEMGCARSSREIMKISVRVVNDGVAHFKTPLLSSISSNSLYNPLPNFRKCSFCASQGIWCKNVNADSEWTLFVFSSFFSTSSGFVLFYPLYENIQLMQEMGSIKLAFCNFYSFQTIELQSQNFFIGSFTKYFCVRAEKTSQYLC